MSNATISIRGARNIAPRNRSQRKRNRNARGFLMARYAYADTVIRLCEPADGNTIPVAGKIVDGRVFMFEKVNRSINLASVISLTDAGTAATKRSANRG